MCDQVRIQLDGQARADWLAWAGEELMPETAQKQREADEREAEAQRKQAEDERKAEEAAALAEIEKARRAEEERAAEFERRRETAEDNYLAGTINVDELQHALDAIRDEEQAAEVNQGGEKESGDASGEDNDESQTADETGEPKRTVGGGTKRKEREEEDVEMRAVDGPVSTELAKPRTKANAFPVRPMPKFPAPGRMRNRGERPQLQEM